MLAAPVAWQFGLKDYQKARITSFLDPSQDAKDSGYQQIQARITVGSGGLTGKGFRQGTQGQLRFLPVAHNDFIFSVLAEEQGFAGVLVALGLYLFVILRSLEAARRFQGAVDAAAVYVNASTRFTDGGEFGMGAEIGISTQKLHARGPIGLAELTTYKYVVRGDGQVRG